MNRQGSNLASYLLFERGFCSALIELGYKDTLARSDEMLAFLGGGSASGTAPDPASS